MLQLFKKDIFRYAKMVCYVFITARSFFFSNYTLPMAFIASDFRSKTVLT